MTKRICILILGMHRSGTSALTRMLNLLGCDIVRSIVPADQFNERGYWEAPDIAALNEAILAAAGSSWQDWFDPAWLPAERRLKFEVEALRLLRAHFAESELFLLKDPRISRLLPLWRKVLTDFGAEPRAVITWRDPAEVAASLQARDKMHPARGHLSWLDHTLSAERDTRDLPRAFVHFPDLLSNWSRVAEAVSDKLGLTWPRHPQAARGQIEEFLTPKLRHHDRGSSEEATRLAYGPWIGETLTYLREDPDSFQACKHFDMLNAEVSRAAMVFGLPLAQLAEHGRHQHAQLTALRSEADRAAKQAEALEAEVQASRTAADKAAKQAEALEAEVQASRTAADKAARQAETMHILFAEASRSLAQRDAEIETYRQQLRAIEQSRSWRLTSPYRSLGTWQRRNLQRLAPTPLGQRLIRLRNLARRMLR